MTMVMTSLALIEIAAGEVKMRSSRGGVLDLVHSVFRKQPIEQASDPIGRQFKLTRAQFIAQQKDFNNIVGNLLEKTEKKFHPKK